jgi:Protein of unknown function (DUF3828)
MREIFGIVACVGLGIIASMVTYADAADASAKTPAAWAGPSAEDFLHSIYDRYVGPPDKARPIDYSKPRDLKHYFEPSLAGIMHSDFIRAKKADDVPTLDADPFIDAQDWEIKSFDIQVTAVDGDHANALIEFDNTGEHKLLHIQLVRIAGNWRIHDIDYGGGEGTLRGLYKAGGSKK